MDIKCKSSKRFLFKIDTNSFYDTIENLLKIKDDVPLVIEVPCKKCGMIEVYEIYRDKYIHKKSYKR